jgi:anti-anti-sigma factor
MELKVRRKGNTIILDLSGRIDVNSANFIEVIGQCISEGYCDILCNFEDVEFIDYMGISALVIAFKDVMNNKGRMGLFNIPAHLKGLFSVAGIDRSIDIYATEELAISNFKEDKVIENIKKLQLRRRFKRLPMDIKVELKVKHEKNPACFEAEMLNLSGIGAFLYGCDKFKLGDEVVLTLKLPPRSEEMKLDAKVVWLSDKQVQLHSHPGMGVEFYNISPSTQEKLIEFIDRNLSYMSSEE